ncbi:MAG: ABC transporter permease [Gemmatimonadaceae bacterium]|nr:ABC transporter permease [Gemmatimonadaceae bacterium]NUQ94500.1 ABC transporter permease [Gemmatimonadaceae bacterium]
MRTIRFLLRKEYRQIFRDRVMVAQIFMVPIIQMLVLANAATFSVRSVQLWVVDDDRSSVSRAIVDRLTASGRFVLAGSSASMAEADDALLDRRAGLILHLPARLERELVRTRRGEIQMIFNAEDGAAAGIASAYAQRIVAGYGAELAAELRPAVGAIGAASDAPRAAGGSLDLRLRGWYNPELDYRDFMVPGILVVLVTIVGSMLTAVNIAREKELGTLDQLNVTPVTKTQFIAGKLIPLWSIGLVELGVGLAFAHAVFGVPVRGSLWLVFGAAAMYLVVALGIGLLVSAMVDTQQQAMFVIYFILIVYLLMSGLFTPVRSMPVWAQWVSAFTPVQHFVTVMRSVLLKGGGVGDVWRELLVLAGYGVVVFWVAVRQYRKRVA